MSQAEETTEGSGDYAEEAGAPLLTSKASAITGFTLAVLTLWGQGAWSTAIQSFLGTNFGFNEYLNILSLVGLVTLAIAVAGMLLGRRAFTDPDASLSWEGHLGRAAVVLGGLGAVIAVVTVLGSVLGQLR